MIEIVSLVLIPTVRPGEKAHDASDERQADLTEQHRRTLIRAWRIAGLDFLSPRIESRKAQTSSGLCMVFELAPERSIPLWAAPGGLRPPSDEELVRRLREALPELMKKLALAAGYASTKRLTKGDAIGTATTELRALLASERSRHEWNRLADSVQQIPLEGFAPPPAHLDDGVSARVVGQVRAMTAKEFEFKIAEELATPGAENRVFTKGTVITVLRTLRYENVASGACFQHSMDSIGRKALMELDLLLHRRWTDGSTAPVATLKAIVGSCF